jgi:hypothetical protein
MSQANRLSRKSNPSLESIDSTLDWKKADFGGSAIDPF